MLSSIFSRLTRKRSPNRKSASVQSIYDKMISYKKYTPLQIAISSLFIGNKDVSILGDLKKINPAPLPELDASAENNAKIISVLFDCAKLDRLSPKNNTADGLKLYNAFKDDKPKATALHFLLKKQTDGDAWSKKNTLSKLVSIETKNNLLKTDLAQLTNLKNEVSILDAAKNTARKTQNRMASLLGGKRSTEKKKLMKKHQKTIHFINKK